jgi:hypothetical protein
MLSCGSWVYTLLLTCIWMYSFPHSVVIRSCFTCTCHISYDGFLGLGSVGTHSMYQASGDVSNHGDMY